MNTIDQTEMIKLAIGLHERNINFKARSFCNGLQIIVGGWDAVCHGTSYGHEIGLIETMGLDIGMDSDDDVVGYLTSEEILEVVDREVGM